MDRKKKPMNQQQATQVDNTPQSNQNGAVNVTVSVSDTEAENTQESKSFLVSDYDQDLTLHDGKVVPAKGKIPIDNVSAIQNHPVCGQWIKAGILSIES